MSIPIHEIDHAYLQSLYHNDAAVMAQIFELLIADLPLIQAQLTYYQTNITDPTLFEYIHKHKTSFAFVGLKAITTMMNDFEKNRDTYTDNETIQLGLNEIKSTIQLASTHIIKYYATLQQQLGK